jgi:hypothetical protein
VVRGETCRDDVVALDRSLIDANAAAIGGDLNVLALGVFQTTGTVNFEIGVNTVTRTGTGVYDISFESFSYDWTQHLALITVLNQSRRFAVAADPGTGVLRINSWQDDGTAADVDLAFVVIQP